jgi:hypothetical protein
MCRDDNHGGRRCPSDTSEARRRRRKAAATLTQVSATSIVINAAQPNLTDITIRNIKTEIDEVKELLQAPIIDIYAQRTIDAALELRVTRIGNAITEEVDNRMGFPPQEAQTKIENDALQMEKEIAELNRELSENNTLKWEIYDYDFSDKGMTDSEIQLKEKELDVQMEKVINIEGILERKIEAKKNELLNFRKQAAQEYALKLSEKNKEILAEIRELGGELSLHKHSDKKAVELLHKTVGQYFPSDWINSSNDRNDNMRLISFWDGQRPYYTEQGIQYGAEGETTALAQYVAVAIPYKFAHEAIARLNQSEGKVNGDVMDTLINSETFGESVLIEMEKRVPFNKEEHTMINGMPEGDNWHYGYTYKSPERKNKSGISPEKQWYQLEKNEQVVLPELAVYYEASRIHNAEAVAYHEFSHRAELVVANDAITRLEKSFLERRTTDTDGKREQLSSIYPNNKDGIGEVGRRDNFIDHYMGKEYLSTKHKEVLSMGVESIFSGKRGGLVGMEWTSDMINPKKGEWTKSDNDYRAFCFGVLATA